MARSSLYAAEAPHPQFSQCPQLPPLRTSRTPSPIPSPKEPDPVMARSMRALLKQLAQEPARNLVNPDDESGYYNGICAPAVQTGSKAGKFAALPLRGNPTPSAQLVDISRFIRSVRLLGLPDAVLDGILAAVLASIVETGPAMPRHDVPAGCSDSDDEIDEYAVSSRHKHPGFSREMLCAARNADPEVLRWLSEMFGVPLPPPSHAEKLGT